MAKMDINQLNKRKRNQLANSYFEQKIKSDGENFLNFMNAIQVKKDAFKIFKDLAHGNIDIERHGKFFTNASFVNNLRAVAEDNYKINSLSANGLQIAMQMNNISDKDTVYVMNALAAKADAYMVLTNFFNMILIDIVNYGGANIPQYLYGIINELNPRKEAFNGNFIIVPRNEDYPYPGMERRNFYDR